MTPVQARTRRRAAGLAMSLAVHGGVLLAFMSVAPRLVTLPRLPAPPEPVVELELRPHPRARGSEPSPPQRASTIRASPSLAARRPRGAPLSTPPRSATPAAISAGHNIAAGVAAPGDGEGRWRVSGGGDAAAAARALVRGAVGCGASDYLHLTADERDHCNAEFVRGMRTLRVDDLPAAKRAYYDAVVARTQAARDPGAYDTLKQHENEPPGPHAVDMAAEARCFIRLGAGAARTNRDDPCRLRLPLSPLTAETRVPPPPTLADQAADARAAAKLDAPAPPR